MKHSLFLLLALLAAPALMAQTKPETLNKKPESQPSAGKDLNFPYPELLVQPRATERLQLETKTESAAAWFRYLPIQTSALTTLIAASFVASDASSMTDDTKKDQAAFAANAGYGVGFTWLLTTAAFSLTYRPYAAGIQKVRRSDKGTSELVRERMAEESLEDAADLNFNMRWIAVLSNVAVTGFMAASAKDQTAVAASGLAALVAFAPLVLSDHWGDVFAKHQEYKKRIYGPVSGLTLYRHAQSNSWGPMLSLTVWLP